MTTLEVLQAAREKIEDPDNWTQGEYAVDGGEMRCGPTSFRAYAYCSIGALCAVTGRGAVRAMSHPSYAALERFALMPHGASLPDFNDSHTHAEVLAMFDKAIAVCEREAS